MDSLQIAFSKIKNMAQQKNVFAELMIVGSDNLSLGFRDSKLEKFTSNQTQTAGLRLVFGSSQAYAWTENLSEESLIKVFNETLQNVLLMNDPNEEKIATPQEIQETSEMKDLFCEDEIPMDLKLEKAKELEEAAKKADSRILNVPYAGFSESKSNFRILNSLGLDKEFKQSYFTGHSYPLAAQDGVKKMEGKSFFARTFSQAHAKETAIEATKKTVQMLGAKKLKTGNYATILDKEVAQKLIAQMDYYFSAKNIYENKSLLRGKLGARIASEEFTLIDNPLEKLVPGVRPFDDEGCASKITPLIEKGIVKNFLTNLEFAKKMNMPHTASASRSPASEMSIGTSNLIVTKGKYNFEQMLKKHSQIVHLTAIGGGLHSGFNATTGDFSLPGEGFLYIDGKSQGPVDQFVFSGNIFEMLKQVEAVGDVYCDPSSVLTPDLLIKELSFAGA